MWAHFRARQASDRGDSMLVTLMFVAPIFFMILVTCLDTSFYFSNRANVQQIARDGARQVAILGGDGTSTSRTALEATYGEEGACAFVANAVGRTADQTQVECKVLARADAANLTTVTITRVDCGPAMSMTVGEPTYCNVTWTYAGMPGAALNYIKNEQGHTPFEKNETRVEARAEVGLTGTSLEAR